MPNTVASHPFDEGFDAQHAGQLRYGCPYADGTYEQKEWLEGWDNHETLSNDEAPPRSGALRRRTDT